jgi:plasmid stability protein
MTYTIYNVPDEIERAIRARAAAEQKSPEQAILEALARDFGVTKAGKKKRDLSDIAGSWEEDPDFDTALADQRRIDWEMWQ